MAEAGGGEAGRRSSSGASSARAGELLAPSPASSHPPGEGGLEAHLRGLRLGRGGRQDSELPLPDGIFPGLESGCCARGRAGGAPDAGQGGGGALTSRLSLEQVPAPHEPSSALLLAPSPPRSVLASCPVSRVKGQSFSSVTWSQTGGGGREEKGLLKKNCTRRA